jgi:hypothetical protein
MNNHADSKSNPTQNNEFGDAHHIAFSSIGLAHNAALQLRRAISIQVEGI